MKKGTIFKVRYGQGARYFAVAKEVYHRINRTCSETGIPFRTGVEYADGRAIKTTTVMEKPL